MCGAASSIFWNNAPVFAKNSAPDLMVRRAFYFPGVWKHYALFAPGKRGTIRANPVGPWCGAQEEGLR